MPLAPGTRLGPYEIRALIGSGGMGEVYSATDARLGREIALKVLPADLAQDPDRLARLEREARALAALNHPNIVTLHSVDDVGDTRFLTMERVKGRVLSELIGREGLPLADLLRIAMPIADALASAHRHGIVHRDLKPANVMVDDEGRVKLLDFGLARPQRDVLNVTGDVRTETVTAEGGIVGTLAYMAPEQLRGEAADQRADIYSFGAMLYEMAAGVRPFRGDTGVDIVSSILREDAVPLQQLRSDLPLRFVQLVSHCLEKDPRRRAQSAHDVWQGLHDLNQELRWSDSAPGVGAQTTAAAKPLRGAWGLAIALLLVLAIAALAAIGAWRFRQQRTAGSTETKSLAVLPFANLTHDQSQDYFVDGMHEALITDLAKLGTLRVVSRNSVLRFRDKPVSLKAVARELGVDAIIEGSVLRAGDKVRITAQLISGSTDEHLWAESYDRDLQDVLGLLSEVSNSIAGEVQSKLGGGPVPASVSPVTRRVEPKAWEAYLRARHAFNYGLLSTSAPAQYLSRTLGEARDLFRGAAATDPGFAEAWSGLAMMTVFQTFFGVLPMAEGVQGGREAARKALAIDPSQGEAYGALGIIELCMEWNFEQARIDLEKAIALSPYDLQIRHFYADYLITEGRPQDSLAQIRIAVEHNPNLPWAHVLVLTHLEMASRNADEVIAEARQLKAAYGRTATSRSAIFGVASSTLFSNLWRRGQYEEALQELRDGNPGQAARLEVLLKTEGPRRTMKILADEAAAASTSRTRPLGIASMYADAEDREGTFVWLEKAVAQRQPQLMYVPAHPRFDFLRNDPRYRELIRRIGMPVARQFTQ